jgi:hypothetical protein
MAYLNDNYLKLKAGYLFPEIGRRVKAFCDANPDAAKRLVRCGIGLIYFAATVARFSVTSTNCETISQFT